MLEVPRPHNSTPTVQFQTPTNSPGQTPRTSGSWEEHAPGGSPPTTARDKRYSVYATADEAPDAPPPTSRTSLEAPTEEEARADSVDSTPASVASAGKPVSESESEPGPESEPEPESTFWSFFGFGSAPSTSRKAVEVEEDPVGSTSVASVGEPPETERSASPTTVTKAVEVEEGSVASAREPPKTARGSAPSTVRKAVEEDVESLDLDGTPQQHTDRVPQLTTDRAEPAM